jgi:hypothetical protein
VANAAYTALTALRLVKCFSLVADFGGPSYTNRFVAGKLSG